MKKVAHLIQDFKKQQITKEIISKAQDIKTLRENLNRMFPPKEVIESFMNISRKSEADSDYIYSAICLPRHTRDNAWLAKYIDSLVNISENIFQSSKVKFNHIQSFVKNDAKFDAERIRYEEDVVCAEIKYLVAKRIYGSNKNKQNQKQYTYRHNADEAFRQEVSDNMIKLGIDHYSIEASLEKNAQLWREQTMDLEFMNQFLRPLNPNKKTVSFEQYTTIVSDIIAKRNDWMALREYEYYQKHKNIIDHLGLATPNMKMKPQEVITKNTAWHNEYQAIIEPIADQNNDQMYDFVLGK